LSTRRGRRVGGGDTRGAILDAATALFARDGYTATTLRAVAREAAVDPALIVHHFGSKDALFRNAMQVPIDPAVIAAAIEDADRDRLGERLCAYFLELWEDESTRQPLLTILRSALTHEAAAEMMRGFISDALVGRIASVLELPDAELRATLVGSQLVGLAIARYALRVEPLASAEASTIAAWLAPTLQRYLTA
jgi:AcrR family transcriptional regulator